MTPDMLRPFLSRILSPFIAMAITWLAAKGIDFGPDSASYFTEFAVAAGLPLFLALNAVIHKLLDKKINPGDAASSHLAAREQYEAKVIKAKTSDE